MHDEPTVGGKSPTEEVCPCHGVPWQGEGRRRRCRVKARETSRRWYHANPERERERKRLYRRRNAETARRHRRERYHRLVAEGRCPQCGGDRPINVYCWDCLSKMEYRRMSW